MKRLGFMGLRMLQHAFPLLVILCACGQSLADISPSLELVVDGLRQPLFVADARDGSGRLFIVEQGGRILILKDGVLRPEAFLDISHLVQSGGERGLLGLAFHPRYSQNGRFFVNYTRQDTGRLETAVAEYNVSASDPDLADPNEKLILRFDQPFNNHNGGMLAFGPDGLLYVAVGDGGSAGDPRNNGQSLSTLLGKILRIDVDGAAPYTIPPDNPFVGQEGIRAEIFAYGLRNPWRFSFDRVTGDLLAGDVGQNSWEEVDLIEAGRNYGWRIMEGNHCFNPSISCDMFGLTPPITEYSRAEGRSVTGGYVYRGLQPTRLQGSYIFGDYPTGRIWSLSQSDGGVWERALLMDTKLLISSFGEDRHGEMYVVDHAGGLYRMIFGQTTRFAHVGDGLSIVGTLKSSVVLVNNNNREVEGRLALIGSNGVIRKETRFTIPALTSWVHSTPGDSKPLFAGWAEVTSSAPIAGTVLFSLLNGFGSPIAEAGVASSDPGTHWVAPVQILEAHKIDTGFAMANPSQSETALVELTIKGEGLIEKKLSFALGPRTHLARFVSQAFAFQEDFEGTALIESDRPIIVTLLRTKDGIQSASLPVAD